MTLYNPGDIVLIPFPFTDFSMFKQRPAVIRSSGEFNRSGSDVIIAAITSHLREKNTYDYVLDGKEQEAAGLPLPSAVKVGKIVTIDQRLIRKPLGHLFPNQFLPTMPKPSREELAARFVAEAGLPVATKNFQR